MTTPRLCTCNPPTPVIDGGAFCRCGHKLPAPAFSRDTITDRDRRMAEWLIKQHQRMIHEIRERYGLKA